MNALTSPRPRRPVNARVTPVSRPAATARRCASPVPASGQSKKAVPTWTAVAPTASAASTPPAVCDPAGSDQRNGFLRCDCFDEFEQRYVAIVAVLPRATVALRLRPLDDERVRTAGRGRARLL